MGLCGSGGRFCAAGRGGVQAARLPLRPAVKSIVFQRFIISFIRLFEKGFLPYIWIVLSIRPESLSLPAFRRQWGHVSSGFQVSRLRSLPPPENLFRSARFR